MKFYIPVPGQHMCCLAAEITPEIDGYNTRVVITFSAVEFTLFSPLTIVRRREPNDPPGTIAFVERMEVSIRGSIQPGLCGGHWMQRDGKLQVLAHNAEVAMTLPLEPAEVDSLPSILLALAPLCLKNE